MEKSNIPARMKAWQLYGFGIQNLKLESVTTPGPKPHEVLVKVGAVSLNYRDKAIIDGTYPGPIPNPLVPVADVAGTVVGIGSEVKNIRIGDRVLSHLWSHWLDGGITAEDYKYVLGSSLPGGLSEYMVMESQSVVKVPDEFTDEEASTFPIAGLTAWFSLVNHGNLQAGQSVLIQGSGGVSIFGIQIAKALGAKVIVTTGSSQKIAKIKEIGADEVINYLETPDWVTEVLRLTEGRGVDHLLEVVGGDGLNDSARAVKYNGHISLIGFLSSQSANLDLITIMIKQVKLQGIVVGHLKALEEMINTFAQKGLKPIIEKVYSFEDAVSAFKHLDRGSLGKIVIKVS